MGEGQIAGDWQKQWDGWLAGANLPGWTSLMAAVGLLGGMQFLMLGIIGAYLGRLYDQSKGRPLFMIRDIVGGGR